MMAFVGWELLQQSITSRLLVLMQNRVVMKCLAQIPLNIDLLYYCWAPITCGLLASRHTLNDIEYIASTNS